MALSNPRTRAILIVIGVFVIGALFGAAVERFYHPFGALSRRRPPSQVRGFEERALEHLQSRLDLSRAQRDTIAVILRGSRERTQDFRSRIRDEMRAIDLELRAGISATLTEEQRETFDAMRRITGSRRGFRGGRDSTRSWQGLGDDR